jgi:hypothetical protein
MAQVYSVNGVGYFTLDLPVGYSLIANQLNNGDNNLNTIIPDAPIGTTLAKWNNAMQTFFPDDSFFGPMFGGWVDGSFAPTATTLNPGEGAFINMAAPASVTFVGEIPQGDLSVTINPLFNIVSQPTPQAAGVAATGLPASVGDVISFWDNTTQSFEGDLTYFGPAYGGWVDTAFTPVDPTPAVGESFYYNSAAPSSVDWNRTFSIND